MNKKKYLAVFSVMFFIGGTLAVSAEPQSRRVQRRSEVQAERGVARSDYQNRLRYRDENGDGIHDGFRDHDNDGVPNCQDPDWAPPQDGAGYQNRIGQRESSRWNGMRSEGQGQRTWSRQSFRWNNRNFGSGVCDPRRSGSRRGGRNGRSSS